MARTQHSAASSGSHIASPKIVKSFLKGVQSVPMGRQTRTTCRAHTALKVEAARTLENKKALVESLTEKIDSSMLVAGMRYEGFSVKQFEKVRNAMPEGTKIVVAKNTLYKKAAEKSSKNCEQFNNLLKGPNAFLIVEENIPGSLKAIQEFKKKEFKEINEELGVLEFVGGQMDTDFFAPGDVQKLEDMPTKQELIAKIAYMINSIPTKTARGINMVPTKIGYGVKAIPNKVGYGFRAVKDKLEEEGEN